MKRITTALFVLFYLIGTSLQAQSIEELENYIEEARISHGITGMAIGIVKDGEVVMERGFGLRKAGEDKTVDEHTLFAIASISKAFTVTALSMLEQEGKLSWSDHVHQHLPYFRLKDDYVSSLITLEDLTCHRSGLATFDGDLLWYGTNYSREEIVRRIAALPLKKTFRLDFGYQNIMFITCGEIIHKTSGMPWEDFLSSRIFKPLGMTDTKSSIKQFVSTTNFAAPHIEGKPIQLLNYDNSGATAALNSSVSDMNKWVSMWLNRGVYNNDTLLSISNYNRIWTPHTVLTTGNFDSRNNTHFKSYGMGWFLMDYNGYKVNQHGGGLPGYISKITVVPELDLGFIILTNDNTSLPTALMYKIIDHYSGKNDRDWSGEFLEYKKKSEERKQAVEESENKSRIKGTLPSHQLAAYAGTYEDVMYGKATVTISGDKLKLVMEPTKELFTSELNHWHYDTFEIKFKDPFLPRGFVTFETNKDGAVSGFKINLPNPDFHFYNLNFHKLL